MENKKKKEQFRRWNSHFETYIGITAVKSILHYYERSSLIQIRVYLGGHITSSCHSIIGRVFISDIRQESASSCIL
jgi:hypothetical protein